jgi:regulator of RNase E activity RraA
MNLPIGCGGVLVMPGDMVVGDAEGVAVIPAALAEEVAHDAWEQELVETWALERVGAGDELEGVYPIGDERKADYEEWRRRKESGE